MRIRDILKESREEVENLYESKLKINVRREGVPA